jgi:antitoxin component YwqK of YwqJK toxin-antitoxin module
MATIRLARWFGCPFLTRRCRIATISGIRLTFPLAICAMLLVFQSTGPAEQLCVSQSSNDDQHLPDGTTIHVAKFKVCNTGADRGVAAKTYEKSGITYRTTRFWPDGEIANDCYADVTNQTCVGSLGNPPMSSYPYDSSSRPYFFTTTAYGDHKQIVSEVKTCRGQPMSEEHFDANGYRDGTYFIGQDCPPVTSYPPNTSMYVKATYDHGVLSGHYVQRFGSGKYTLEGEISHGLRWGSWKVTPATTPTSITSINAGTGVWSISTDRVPLEEGVLVQGKEDGLWRYGDGSVVVASGNFASGVMDGEWRAYISAPYGGPYGPGVLEKGDLKVQYAFSRGVPDGPFVAYDPVTGERIEGTTAHGFPGSRFPGILCANWFSGDNSPIESIYRTSITTGTGFIISAPNGKSREFPPLTAGKIVGTWKFYDKTGRLLGADDLSDTNKHFNAWRSSGDKACEGDIDAGTQNGDWIQYDYGNKPIQVMHWDHGVVKGSDPIPLKPPQTIK